MSVAVVQVRTCRFGTELADGTRPESDGLLDTGKADRITPRTWLKHAAEWVRDW